MPAKQPRRGFPGAPIIAVALLLAMALGVLAATGEISADPTGKRRRPRAQANGGEGTVQKNKATTVAKASNSNKSSGGNNTTNQNSTANAQTCQQNVSNGTGTQQCNQAYPPPQSTSTRFSSTTAAFGFEREVPKGNITVGMLLIAGLVAFSVFMTARGFRLRAMPTEDEADLALRILRLS